MSKKSLGGAKYFEAMGRRDNSLGISALARSPQRKNWPSWADDAYMRGRILQMEIPKGVITKNHIFGDPIDVSHTFHLSA